jgi:rubrerythrin
MAILRTLLRPAQAWVWNDRALTARNLLRFAETEADGGRDLIRAAELTHDPILRRLLIRHASDEQRHASLFRQRGLAILDTLPRAARGAIRTDWITPGERGLDDLKVDGGSDASLLAFVHLSEKAASEAFAVYRDLLAADPDTRTVFDEILRDETFHMNYTLAQLGRIAPQKRGWLLWKGRLGRLWKGYLRIAAALAGLISGVVLTILYFVLLPPFAWAAKAAARKEPRGWTPVAPPRSDALRRQY